MGHLILQGHGTNPDLGTSGMHVDVDYLDEYNMDE